MITQTEKKTDNTRDVSNGTPSKARWCTHCAKNLSTGESLTHHIRTEHNDVVVKENDGQERTKVVHFKLEDVADASNCPSTPAYNVLCPVDCSPQDANPMPPGEYNIGASTSTSCHRNENPIPPGEYNIGASTSTSSPLQGLANRENFTCEHCGKSERSHKALQYHMVRAHGVPFKKRKRRRKKKEGQTRTNHSPPLQPEGRPSVQDTQPPTRGTEEQPTQEETRETERKAGIALIGETLRVTFPLPKLMHCPARGRTAPFTTAKWTWTVGSVKRHLRAFHKIGPTQVQYWCAPCGRRIKKTKPTLHPCLQQLEQNEREARTGAWPCQHCEETFPDKKGVLNHERTHRRNAIRESLPTLNIPEGRRDRRARMRERLAPLITGEPGDMRLAPPPTHLPDTPPTQSQTTRNRDTERAQLGGRIDIRVPSVLDSFIEPLYTLLQVDEIGDARAHFESIVRDVTRAVHEHFNLQRPQRNPRPNGHGGAGLDLLNHQKVQQAYKWNRRKCVRAITQDTAQRCPVSMDETYEFFKSVWETSSSPDERRHGETPTRPPIVETLSQAFVAECLRAAENSAPGQDMIAYRHWKEIDPDCAVLTRIYNICLKMANIPEEWKSSRTILIHKKGAVSNLENWRPISLTDTIYKLFTKCLAKKLSGWCETHEVLSPAQKGFSPYDGVLEHNFLLTQHLETASRCKKDKFVAWLDISNAFGSVPDRSSLTHWWPAGLTRISLPWSSACITGRTPVS
ncbi:retrovirus-related Pol polyprotein from type-2 retrotransposable element R2DM [Trichonephila clavipes]|nr:retrovirus-related Pol polyprotein from type-2 retrotransposable element R2DM [Trichonephila clavipes]